jgi:hypothetical protein
MKRDGWERLSIRANTRPIRVPVRTTPDDFLLPSGPGTAGMVLQCGVAAFAIALFFVLLPLTLAVAYTPLGSLGTWWPWATGVAWIAAWAGLVVGAIRENRAIAAWLDDQ